MHCNLPCFVGCEHNIAKFIAFDPHSVESVFGGHLASPKVRVDAIRSWSMTGTLKPFSRRKVHISPRITKLGLPRVCDLSWAANGWPSWFSYWCRLSLVLFEWFRFTWLFNTGNWMPEKKNQTAWVTVILKKWGQLAEVTRIPGRNLA